MFKKTITIALFFGAIGILLSLSYWQIQRLSWKEDFIAKLDVEYSKDPTQHPLEFTDLNSIEAQETPLIYGQVTGKFHYDKQLLWGPKPLNGKIGYNIVTPLQLTDGEYVLVHRGWIEQTQKDSVTTYQPTTSMTITGLFRKPDWNLFTPNNSPKNDVWTKPDINEIAQLKNIAPIAPVMLYAHQISEKFDGVTLNHEKWYPRNKHKQYAIFWFAMGLAFIGVFAILYFRNYKVKL